MFVLFPSFFILFDFSEFIRLPGSHPLDYSVSLFIFSASLQEFVSLLVPVWPHSRAHTRALTGCNAGAPVT